MAEFTFHLRYFNLRARGEPIRWILRAVGMPYTEERIELEDWDNLKQDFSFGRCPVLEVNGNQLHQTTVICKFIGQSFDLVPSGSPFELAKLEEVVESIHDISEHFALYFVARLKKDKHTARFFREKSRTRAFEVAELIEKTITKEGWIRTPKMTWVDVFVACYMNIFSVYFSTIFENHPKVANLVDKVQNLPEIKAWLKIRPPLHSFEVWNDE